MPFNLNLFRLIQVGITPYTVACNYAGRLRVYTRVSPYVEWMKNIMNSSAATTQPSTVTTQPSKVTFQPSTATNQPSTATNQRQNTFIFEILFILIIMFL
jgi:secreted trypsin-like serine protease